MMDQDKGMTLDHKTAGIVDKLTNNAETKDVEKLMKITGATPANFKELLFELQLPLELIEGEITNFVHDYISRVKKEVDAAIADERYDRSFIEREKQISVYYERPFLSEEEFTYAR